MNHRVSIVVSCTSMTESGLGSPEVSLKASCSCLSKSVFSKYVCIALFFIVEPCAEFTCYSPLVLCHSFSFSGQCSTVDPTQGPSTPLSREFSSIILALFFCFFFLPTNHSQSSVTVVCVLRASSCWWKKSDSPTSCVFAVVTVSAWRTHVWRSQIHK